MNAFARWFGRVEHDGAAAALERAATDLPEAVTVPAPAGDGLAPGHRRRRTFASTRKVMLEAMSQKVLHGWLQNRHQTLLPLTVNLRTLADENSRLLAEVTAAAVLASSSADSTATAAAELFLRNAGADDAMVAVFNTALAAPSPLYRLFGDVRAAHNLGPLAYICMVAVNETRDPANAIFLQWAAAKLELPTTVVRSVERRYRR